MHALVRRYCPFSVILILMNSPAASNGQSLLETMFVLFVVAMLCSAAVSGLHMMQTRVRIQAAAEDMLNTVLNARTEALRREKRISICVAAISSDAGASVAPAETPARCAGANAVQAVNSWQQGWLVFEDDNSNGMWDAGEILLMQHASLKLPITARGNTTVNRYVSFGASGRSLALNGAFQAGTLTFCEHLAKASPGWLLVVNAVGRPRLEKTQISECP